jgi:hypothetical protein
MTGTSGGLVLGLVPRADVDADELAALGLGLRRRLLDETDVEDVRWVRAGAVPCGAKSVEAIEVGALVVSAAPAVWRGVLDVVQTWLRGRPVRSVKVELDGRSIELTGASPEQQRLLVAEFLRAGRERTGTEDAATGAATGRELPGGR